MLVPRVPQSRERPNIAAQTAYDEWIGQCTARPRRARQTRWRVGLVPRERELANAMKRILIIVAVLGVTGASIGFLVTDHDGSSTSYRLVPVTRGTVEATVSATGTLSAVTTVQVGTQVSGQIAALYADFNDHVHKGELIAKLDPTLLEEAVHQAQADLAHAQADLEQKQFTLDQDTSLYRDKAITEAEYRTAEYNLAMSRANLLSSKSALERAQRNLRYTSIYSPIDGIVIERDVNVGQTVAASFSAPQLFLIAQDLGHMQILASVDESDIGQIHDGQEVRFTVQAYPNRTFTGTVQQVRLQSSTVENVVNYTVVVAVPNPDGALLPGMTATVSFEVARAANVLEVSNAALRFRPTEEMLAAARRDRNGSEPDSLGAHRGTDGERFAGPARAEGARRASDVAQIWYLDAQGQPAVARVRAGMTDGQETEISGPEVHEGMQAIAGIASREPDAGVSNPFQGGQSRGFRRPGGF
jgi:HlyD family secretion protein